MRYYKYLDGDYIISIGTGSGGVAITEAEYNAIMGVIRTRPTAPEGYRYRLNTDLTWELYELPPAPPPEEEEATEEDYLDALNQLGVNTNEEE